MASVIRPLALASTLWLAAAGTVINGNQATSPQPPGSGAPQQKAEEGIPIQSPVVQKACAPCHALDDKQQMSRISFRRSTPEGWQTTIRRMVALNGMRIEPHTAREVVKYLSDNLGLAPEEARPAAFETERRLIDFTYAANADTQSVCTRCHTLGRVISQRRTRDEWNLLIAMHRGWYPLVDNQAFRRPGPAPRDPSPDGGPPDTRQPVEKVVDHLARTFPLKTPEWAGWSATMRPARLEGTWTIRGHALGRGPVYGHAVIKAVPSSTDEYTTEITLLDARTGTRVTRTGEAIIYTGYQWRGRNSTSGPAPPAAGADEAADLREVMIVDRDWRTMEGRWFRGAYDETGLDVTLERAGSEPRVLGAEQTAPRVGSTAQSFRLYGANFPASLQPAQIDFGPGITVTSVRDVTADQAMVTVDVAPTAPIGARDVFVAGASRPRAVAVYKRIDALKVAPEWAMARVGGIVHPKGFAQFEARGFDNGPDGRPDTADDIDLGLVPATWTLEEFAATYDDDDVKFVGHIDPRTGRFTPNVDGPNPQRSGERNNIGDVYAVATYTPEPHDGTPARTIRARAHLLVTVPLYMWWEDPK
jgi:quinohemoprotein amine dehydrogenase